MYVYCCAVLRGSYCANCCHCGLSTINKENIIIIYYWIVGALASIIFPMHLKIQNDRPPATEINDFRCEWVNVSPGTGPPG